MSCSGNIQLCCSTEWNLYGLIVRGICRYKSFQCFIWSLTGCVVMSKNKVNMALYKQRKYNWDVSLRRRRFIKGIQILDAVRFLAWVLSLPICCACAVLFLLFARRVPQLLCLEMPAAIGIVSFSFPFYCKLPVTRWLSWLLKSQNNKTVGVDGRKSFPLFFHMELFAFKSKQQDGGGGGGDCF